MASPIQVLLSFFLLSFLFLLSQSPTLSANSEGDALFTLKKRLSDPNKVLKTWDPTLVNPCTWFHVTCNNFNSVVRLDLGNAGLSGELGSELAQLPNLQYLEVYANKIGGKIPKELGKLKELVSLDLYDNQFHGVIPRSFGKLKSLKFLRLNNNRLTGPIPRELVKLSNLSVFDVSNNDLCGTIPVEGPFSKFTRLSFANNSRLRGPALQGLVPYNTGC